MQYVQNIIEKVHISRNVHMVYTLLCFGSQYFHGDNDVIKNKGI